MINNNSLLAISATILALSVCGCRVETNTEPVPEAEGSGKKAVNIRVEPMSREEIKDATNRAIDTTAEVASRTRDLASTAAENAERLGRNITTLTDTMINVNRAEEQPDTEEEVTVTTTVATETE